MILSDIKINHENNKLGMFFSICFPTHRTWVFSTVEDLMQTVANLLTSISGSGLKLAKFLLITAYWDIFAVGKYG